MAPNKSWLCNATHFNSVVALVHGGKFLQDKKRKAQGARSILRNQHGLVGWSENQATDILCKSAFKELWEEKGPFPPTFCILRLE